MTEEQKIKAETEINFANQGAGSYLFCCLWDMIDDHEVTIEDFHHQTDAWKEAVVGCASEAYEYVVYRELWDKIICTSFVEREEHNSTAKHTAEKIKDYLIGKAIDGTLDLDFNNLDFSHLVGDGLEFNSEGRIEEGCEYHHPSYKHIKSGIGGDCCQSN